MNLDTINLLNQLTSKELIEAIDHPKFLEIKTKYPEKWEEIKMAYHSEIERIRSGFMDVYCNAVNECKELEANIDTLEKEKDELKIELLKLEKENSELKLKLEYNSKPNDTKVRLTKAIFIGIGSLLLLGFFLAVTDKEAYKATTEGLSQLLVHAKDILMSIVKLI